MVELDGRSFRDLDGFTRELSRVIGTPSWGTNLDAFYVTTGEEQDCGVESELR